MLNMDRLQLKHLHIARFQVEAKSGFAIASGLTDVAFDNLLVRDANGFPAIPGTSLAGMLRSAYAVRYLKNSPSGDKELASIFGDHIPSEDGSTDAESIKSRVEVSWGVVHDQYNEPVEELLSHNDDQLLQFLSVDHPINRDHVAINEYGSAEHALKFDTTVMPRGVRFSAEISLWSNESEPLEWERLLALIWQDDLYIGSKRSSGLGQFACVDLKHRSFDLSLPQDFDAFSCLNASVSASGLVDWDEYIPDGVNPTERSDLTLRLEAEDFWRVGQGASPLFDTDHPSDLRQYHEPAIVWHENSNAATLLMQSIVIAGSSIKGALRHRVRFHYARHLIPELGTNYGAIANSGNDTMHEGYVFTMERAGELADEACRYVFGSASDSSGDADEGHQSRLRISEARPENPVTANDVSHLSHSSIDRYTGGVRNGALFSEELLYKNELTIKLEFSDDLVNRLKGVDEGKPNDVLDSALIAEALRLTFDDLLEGRLSLGASQSRGHGYFSGTVNGPVKRWLYPMDSETGAAV